MMTMQKLEQKLQKADRKQAGLYLLCNFIALMLISAYSAMMFSPTVLTILPEGGDSRKQIVAIFILALFGCVIFTIYAANLFFRKKSRKLGILLALGASKRKLSPGLFREVLALSMTSSLAGILAGFPFTQGLWNLFRVLIVDSSDMRLKFDFRCLTVSFLFFALTVTFSCATAYRCLRKTNIMDIIHEEHKNEPVREPKKYCGLLGILILFAGAIIGYNAPGVYMALFDAYPPAWINLFFAPVFAGLYMIMLHTVVHGWGFRKKHSYQHLISRSMMKFQGRQTVNNLLVCTVLIAGGCFALFYLPMLGTGQILETQERSFDYAFHYRADQNVPTKQEILTLADKYELKLKDWHSGEYLLLGLDGVVQVEDKPDSRAYHYEYRELKQQGKFLSESCFNQMTGQTIDIAPGCYRAVSNESETGTYYLELESTELTNMVTRAKTPIRFDGFVHNEMLLDAIGYYILDDADYEAAANKLTDEWRGNLLWFNADGADSYSFANALLKQFITGFNSECETIYAYDPVEKIAANENGNIYWGDTDEISKISFSNPDSYDFRAYWTYMPKIRILDQHDCLRNFSVFLMMFLFISIVCLTAAFVISHTRCQTIALNNRYVFDNLKRLGASPAFLLSEIRSQCGSVFKTPMLVGSSAMFLLYSLMMLGNDGKLTREESAGLLVCLAAVAAIASALYAVYRLTVRKVAQTLGVR